MKTEAAFNDVGSYRDAAAICGVDRKTVKLELPKADFRPTPQPVPYAHKPH